MTASFVSRTAPTVIRFVPALLWALFIFFLSAQSRLPRVPGLFQGVDKIAHACVFGVLTLLLLFGARFPTGWRAWVCVGVSIAYGVSDEVHQSFVPGRSVEVLDGLADVVGAFIAYGFSRIVAWWTQTPTVSG